MLMTLRYLYIVTELIFSIKAAIHKFQHGIINDVCVWMNNSALRLNEVKTECIN